MGQGYQGPSILSRGSNNVGVRGGEEVDLRFFASVDGIYDTGLLPVASNASGQIATPGGLIGVSATLGAYGVHNFKRSQLALDYKGDYRHYNQNSSYDGSDQALTLIYGYQKSRRLSVEMRGVAGTYSNSLFGNSIPYVGGAVTTGQALFDNRSSFFEGGMDVNYSPSARMILSAGGEGFEVVRQSQALVGVHGYSLRGSVERKLSAVTSIGAFYDHNHFDYPKAFGESNIDGISFGVTRQFDRKRLTVRLLMGGSMIQTEGVQPVQLDPLVASILGVSSGEQAFYQKLFLPRGEFSVNRQFRRANLRGEYKRGVNPGNGVYLTSQEETALGGFDYTGVRKVSIGISGTYSSYSSLGQTLGKYTQYGGDVHGSVTIVKSLRVVVAYYQRKQDIGLSNFTNDASRVQFGLAFSPGTIPLSFR